MNAIWSGSHLHVRSGLSGRKPPLSSPTYEVAAHETVSCKSPPPPHHRHKHEPSTVVKTHHKHSPTCAVHDKGKRAKSHDELNKSKMTPEKIRQSNSSSVIHSRSHALTPELTRKNPCQVHQAKKKCGCDPNKDSSRSLNVSPTRMLDYMQKTKSQLVSQHSQDEDSQCFRKIQNSPPTPSGNRTKAYSSTKGSNTFVFKETSV